ncbi:MAG: transglutaminase domain-containing protein [Smithella sp.]|nr:transglutaminase domain-containing protein [Smithella sp.]HNV56779.1 transglutaminase-like domain-containing protein [Smithellaceae bacterium]HPB15707.1 transglutaminase-like domain-containing protein [Smithellaceae bacterium]HPV72602.1 transglutaminase-like domain-containing protein [Smithellaceae bacterium]
MLKSLKAALIASLLFAALPASAENFTVMGEMDSTIHYELQHQIVAGDSMRKLVMSFVEPSSFDSPTYSQKITNFKITFTPDAQEKKTLKDARGNKTIQATWTDVPKSIDAVVSFDAQTSTGLKAIDSVAPFPLASVPGNLKDYLQASEQVQTNDPAIGELSQKLTRGSKTQFEAVQKVVSYVVDHVRYVNPPPQYDALYALRTGRGNCQNYSHLTAALLRNAGVPVRIVNGVTMNQPFNVSWEKGTLTFKMGQGRHSWVEVWYPDLGWIPYDPQNMQFFISNRFVRIEVGVDNNETKNDGLVRWAQSAGARSKPTLQETIGGNFLSDATKVTAQRQAHGPKNLLLGPDVLARLEVPAAPEPTPAPPVPAPPVPAPPVPAPPVPAPPVPAPEPPKPTPPAPVPPVPAPPVPTPPVPAPPIPVPPVPAPEPPKPVPEPPKPVPPVKPPKAWEYKMPFVFGNLEYPENVDFAFPRETKAKGKDSFEMSRNFLVETSEYVTTNATQYAQVVELAKPVTIDQVGLALHKFGGEGWIWVDIFKDQDGKPGDILHTTQMISLEDISGKPGYRWVDFKFSDKERPVLMPGAYWIALGFSGTPIMNWFYTYGKPVGPVYGTRYKSVFAQDWSGALNYEFNYRVVGMTVK